MTKKSVVTPTVSAGILALKILKIFPNMGKKIKVSICWLRPNTLCIGHGNRVAILSLKMRA